MTTKLDLLIVFKCISASYKLKRVVKGKTLKIKQPKKKNYQINLALSRSGQWRSEQRTCLLSGFSLLQPLYNTRTIPKMKTILLKFCMCSAQQFVKLLIFSVLSFFNIYLCKHEKHANKIIQIKIPSKNQFMVPDSLPLRIKHNQLGKAI